MLRKILVLFFCLLSTIILSCNKTDDNNTSIKKLFKNGVSEDEIIVGMSASFEKEPLSYIGEQLLKGATTYINYINDNGGVNGRKITIKTYDDNYDSQKCIDNTLKLINKDKVFTLFNYPGSNTTVNIIPIIESYKIPLIGVSSGDESFKLLNKGYVFSVRASYQDEMRTIVKYFKKEMGTIRISAFYQGDGYGRVRLAQFEEVLKEEGLTLTSSGSYDTKSSDISEGLNNAMKGNPGVVAIFGIVNQAGNFVKSAYKINPSIKFYFTSEGFDNANYIINLLEGDEAVENIYITQLFPNPWDTHTTFLQKYHELSKKYDPEYLLNYLRVEGYVNAMVLVKAIEMAGEDPTREGLIKALKSMNKVDIDGIKINYGEDDYQGLTKVYIVNIRNGLFNSLQ